MKILGTTPGVSPKILSRMLPTPKNNNHQFAALIIKRHSGFPVGVLELSCYLKMRTLVVQLDVAGSRWPRVYNCREPADPDGLSGSSPEYDAPAGASAPLLICKLG